jgi:hypothetical protein
MIKYYLTGEKCGAESFWASIDNDRQRPINLHVGVVFWMIPWFAIGATDAALVFFFF